MKKQAAAAEHDYSLAQLPHTRREVFFDIFRLYGGSLLRTGFILLSFALPLLICGYIRDDNELAYLALLQEASGAETEELYKALQFSDGLISLFDIPGYIIFSVGLSGVARIIRQYAWEEPVNLKIDFPKGIRQNIKPYLMLGFLTGSWILLSRYCFKGALYAEGILVLLNILPLFIGLLLFLPVLGYALVSNAVYSNSFGQNLRVSLVLYMKKPLMSAGISLLLVSLLLFSDVIPLISVRMLLRIAVILTSPVLLLIWFLFCYNQMDAYINPAYYPELVGKGFINKDD